MTSSRARAWSVVAALAAGPLVFSNAVRAPFWRDDLLQRAMALVQFPAPRGAFALYDFVRPQERAAFVASGALPWWTDDAFSLRFFRPLSSALLFAEHRSLMSALAMHLHSLAWWAVAVLALGWLLHRVLPSRAAAVGVFVFALAPCHVQPLGLAANREALVALALGLLGLTLLAKGDAGPRARLASGVLFALALGAGEYGLCVGGYVLALALDRRERFAQRARFVLPFAVPAAAYLAARSALGYGATGTGFYSDPLRAPGQFLARAPQAFCTLVLDAWSTFDVATVTPWIVLVVGTALLVLALRLAPKGPLRWLVLGSFWSLVPLTASTPGPRLVAPALVGVAAAVGVLVEVALAAPRRWAFTAAALGAVALQLGHAPWASHRLSRELFDHARSEEARAASLAEVLRSHPGGTVVVPLGNWEAAYFGELWAGDEAVPARPWRVLVSARHALVLRVDARTIDVLVPKGQGFFPIGADDIFRPADHALHAGDRRDVPGMHVLVTSTGDEAPPRMRFTFDQDLDDASYLWLTESVDRFGKLAPPAPGFGTQLP